jgi:nucleotide-binding universal stress UspA family protein
MTAPPLRLVVAVDGSDGAARAVRLVADLAPRLGAEVLVVHALGLLTQAADGAPMPAQTHRSEAQAMLEQWADPLAEAGVDFRCEVVDGNPVDSVLRAASDADAAMIVVGKRADVGLPGLQLGSTSAQLVQHAHLPVIVVPA